MCMHASSPFMAAGDGTGSGATTTAGGTLADTASGGSAGPSKLGVGTRVLLLEGGSVALGFCGW